MTIRRAIPVLSIVVSSLILSGCGSDASSTAIQESEANHCLIAAGYLPVDASQAVVTYVRDDGPSVTLAVFQGVVQPSTQGDLDAYRDAGCL